MSDWRTTPAADDQHRSSSATTSGAELAPLICFSHLRWNFVFQRPQHLMVRAAQGRRVFFWEEPIWLDAADADQLGLRLEKTDQGIVVATPVLAPGLDAAAVQQTQRLMLDALVRTEELCDAILWYYTPAALSFSGHLTTQQPVVYDCMDELSAFLGADPSLPAQERALLDRADVVFTGGYSLYEAKRHQHGNVHPLPSGVDLEHFRPARGTLPEPADQRTIPHPRLGFYGVIDERLDTDLVAQLAALRPEWQIILVGPVVKVDSASLPHAENINYLGVKKYTELPAYLSGWDIALMPFARNDATRFISPTKTPEYLAGGKPVVSTPITDVMRHYGRVTGVQIADGAAAFAAAVADALLLARKPDTWLPEADQMLAASSWNGIWLRMTSLIQLAAAQRGLAIGGHARAHWA